MRELVYYVAASVDGYIAGPEGETEAFVTSPELLADIFDRYPETCPTHLRDLLRVSAPARRFDAVVMGARTHEPAVAAGLTSAYPHLRQYVVTRRAPSANDAVPADGAFPADETVTFVGDEPLRFVADLKAQNGAHIWLCGGGQLAGQVAAEIDEVQIKRYPVVLGGGVPLFATGLPPFGLERIATETLPAGVVLETYRRHAAS
jgi:dihydrofolate reductase